MTELTKIARMRKSYFEAKRTKDLSPMQVNEAYALNVTKKREWIRDMTERDLTEAAADGGVSKKEYLAEMKRRGKPVL